MKQNTILVGLSALAVVVSIGLGVFTFYLSGQIQDLRKDQFIGSSQSNYTVSKLEFCINNTITPCNDTHIGDWNKANTKDTFSIKTYQTLVEEGISDYNASRQ